MGGASREHQPTVAVVGSGPSGCFTAQFLRKLWPGSEIAVFDALPAPYGLVRYGVAADHQGTKGISHQFDRLFERGGVRFIGNVRVGTDVSFEDMVEAFDVVVLATGLCADMPLDVPRDPQARVIGAGLLLRVLNGYPGLAQSSGLNQPLGSRVVIVGNGNVAVDALRLLAKDRCDLDGSDIDDRMLEILRPVPVKHIEVVGRSGASNAKFDLTAVRELGQLSNVGVKIGETAGDGHNPVIDVLRDLAARQVTGSDLAEDRVTVTFHFGQSPKAISFHDDQAVLHTRGTADTARTRTFVADSIVTAIGFTEGADTPSEAWDAPNVWRVGWLRRGARGTIPENRRDAKEIGDSIAAAVASGHVALGRPGISAIWPQIAGRVVEFTDWRRLEEYERLLAPEGRCRRKVTDLGEMVTLAVGSGRESIQVA